MRPRGDNRPRRKDSAKKEQRQTTVYLCLYKLSKILLDFPIEPILFEIQRHPWQGGAFTHVSYFSTMAKPLPTARGVPSEGRLRTTNEARSVTFSSRSTIIEDPPPS